jgi:hypothetical protein
VAPWITAPVGSRTVPEMLPVTVAQRGKDAMTGKASKRFIEEPEC